MFVPAGKRKHQKQFCLEEREGIRHDGFRERRIALAVFSWVQKTN